jgi:hypothetical protein
MRTRRTFLAALLFVGILFGATGVWIRGQAPMPIKPGSQEPKQGQDPDAPPLPNLEKKVLEDNDKDMKKKVERLYELASELKDQVDKTDSTKVLSMDLLKKTEEIEKLARDIRNRSKG